MPFLFSALSAPVRMATLTAASAFLFGAGCAHVIAQSAPPPPPTLTGTTGDFSTAVVLVTFSDNAQQPMTAAQANTLVFGGVSDFLWENSYQQTFLSGKTFGWYPIPMGSTVCDTGQIAAQADSAAAAAGADLSGYDQIVYMFPAVSACGWSGTGGTNARGQRLIFITGEGGFQVKVIAHEIGHRFGLFHSNALDCDATPIGNTCTKEGYGDPTDTMGNRPYHFNAFQKELLGWLNTPTTPPITTVTASGRHRIAPYETRTPDAKALKVRKQFDATTGATTHYYLEYRQPIGVDAGMASMGNTTQGVMLHTGVQGDVFTSLVLDMTPNTILTSKAADYFDGALVPGRTFTDAAAGVSITVVSADATGATVDIVLGGGGGSDGGSTPAPAPTLTESVATNKATYARNETVYMSALVKADGVATSGATVKFTIGTPGGGTTILNATSGGDGYARATYKVGKGKAAIGTYALRADASKSGATTTASTTFSAR